MGINIRSLFIDTYKSLVIEFANKIRTVQYENIPEPFFPVHGQLYENAKTRIAFVGMETQGWGNTTEFVNNVDSNPEEAIFRAFEEFDRLEFRYWGNNFGNSFWDFNFKFLANFHEIDDWKKVKEGQEEDILRSFAWCNANAIERYEVTAQKRGVDYKNWLAVKEASIVFDSAKYLLEVLKPNIMVIEYWDLSETWLSKGLTGNFLKQELDDHFWYYFLTSTQTHVLWTAHPTWLNKNRNFDDYIKYLVSFVKKKLQNDTTQ